MKNEKLAFAIGNITDEYIIEASPVEISSAQPFTIKSKRRVLTGLIAAAILLMMGFLTAMAVSEDFREAVLSIFNISAAEVVPVTGQDGAVLVLDIIDDADYAEMMRMLYPDGRYDEQGRDIPGIENLEDARANFIVESFKAYSVSGTQLVEATVTPFNITLESLMNGKYEYLFFKVETGTNSFVYPSETGSGFVFVSEAGVYLAYTDIGIWQIDPDTAAAVKISADIFEGQSQAEIREANSLLYWIDGVQVSPDGAYAVYRTSRDCMADTDDTSVWAINLRTGDEYRITEPANNNDIIGFLSGSHIMVGSLTDTRIVDAVDGVVVPVSFPELPNFRIAAVGHGVVVHSSYAEGSSISTAYISRINLATGALTPITEVVGYLDAEPRFSPSGTMAAIGYGTDPMIGTIDIMLVDLSNGTQALLTSLMTAEQQPDGLIRHCRWASDDTLIVTVQNGSNHQTYMITIGGLQNEQ